MRHILQCKPKTVVELGSGRSSVILGYALEQIHGAQLFSIEHHPDYLRATQSALDEHALTPHVKLVECPLSRQEIGGEEWLWYTLPRPFPAPNIDLLIVDGPPGYLEPCIRYPALPLLLQYFSANTVIMLDDANRPDEQGILARWLAEYPDIDARVVQTQRTTRMKLFFSPNSPYARKCRVVTLEKGLADKVEFVRADPNTNPPELIAANPLATVPTLVVSDSLTLCESPVICEYLDSLSKENPLFPAGGAARFEVLGLAALADGIMDAAVACVLENRKPDDKRSTEWIIRKETAVRRAVADVDRLLYGHEALSIGTIATAVALAYVNFRLAHIGWRADHPELAAWLENFSQRPSMASTKPVA